MVQFQFVGWDLHVLLAQHARPWFSRYEKYLRRALWDTGWSSRAVFMQQC